MFPQEKQHEPISSITRDEYWIGAYVLLIRCTTNCSVRVGRYSGGEPIPLPQGRYLYVGSAMGSPNGLYLPKRLLRHARRSADLSNHDIYPVLKAHFIDQGISNARFAGPATKNLRWNIDYLMDLEDAELEAAAYVRSTELLEFTIVEWLESCKSATAPYPGFGAHDHPGHSHLFAATDAFGWTEFIAALTSQFEKV